MKSIRSHTNCLFFFPDRADHPGSRESGIRREAAGDPLPSGSAPVQPPPAQRHPRSHHLRRPHPRAAPRLRGVTAQNLPLLPPGFQGVSTNPVEIQTGIRAVVHHRGERTGLPERPAKINVILYVNNNQQIQNRFIAQLLRESLHTRRIIRNYGSVRIMRTNSFTDIFVEFASLKKSLSSVLNLQSSLTSFCDFSIFSSWNFANCML